MDSDRRGTGFDVVISSEVFDYLPEGPASELLTNMTHSARAGGIVAICNFAPSDPSRTVKDWVGGWHLIYRTRCELAALFPAGTEPVVSSSPDGGLLYARERCPGSQAPAHPRAEVDARLSTIRWWHRASSVSLTATQTNQPRPTAWARRMVGRGLAQSTTWACMKEEVMRLKHVGNLVAAAFATAAVSAPSAYARWPSPEGGNAPNPVSAQERQPEGSTDWELDPG